MPRFLLLALAFVAALRPAVAAPTTLTLEDFENGIGSWTTNDKVKFSDPNKATELVNVLSVPAEAGGAHGSKLAAMFAFKTATASWASASLPVDGKAWAKIGAQKLSFWLLSSGADSGFDVFLRGRFAGADGQQHEEKFVLTRRVDLDKKTWRQVSIPLSDYRSAYGALPARLANVYMIQVVQTGDWAARFFTLDDIQIEGAGAPLVATPTATSATSTTATATPQGTTLPAAAVEVSADFLKSEGRIKTTANVSLGMTWPDASGVEVFPLESKAYRDTLATLRPRLVRLDAGSLCALVDSSKPSFDFTKLSQAVRHVRDLKMEPLVALTNPPAWGLDEKGYATFAAQTARTAASSQNPVRLFELCLAGPTGLDDDGAVLGYYNRAYLALKTVSKNIWVGGVTSGGERSGALARALAGARGLDFLTLRFSGAPFNPTGAAPATEQTLHAAVAATSLRIAAGQLDKTRFAKAPIFVTQANIVAPGADGEQPADGRAAQMASAAWWVAFLGSGSRIADQVFHSDGANAGWGLIDAGAATPRAYPAYYAMWLWNSFVPPGSERVQATCSSQSLAVTAVNAPALGAPVVHTVLLANLSGTEQAVKVSIRGFPVLREARVRVLDDLAAARTLNTPVILPKSPFQNLVLKPWAVALLQFVEPPKK